MLLRDWWRIPTPYGYVELELEVAGGALEDELAQHETESVLDVLTFCLEHRDPRITRAILEIYAQLNPQEFPPGLALDCLASQQGNKLAQTLIRFLERRVTDGTIRLYEDEVVLTKTDVLIPAAKQTQPPVPEQTTFIGIRLEDADGFPIQASRLRLRLPDGNVKEMRTDGNGAVFVDGIAVSGTAKVEFLDFG